MNVEGMIELVVEQALWDGLAESVHGEKHWFRVFKLADKIMNCMALSMKGKNRLVVNRGVVGLGALLHDIGRVHDGKDLDHGFRGAPIAFKVAGNVFASNQSAMATPKGFYGKMAELGKVCDIVARHCLPGPGDYLEMQIVKDADKLDRVRFGGVKSLDVNRLAWPDICVPIIDDAINLYENSIAIKV